MSRLATLVRHDARLQYRYGIYLAYAFVVAFYVAVLLLGGRRLPDWAVAAVIYSDPAAVGFFFLGALMMLEKGEGVRVALAASPVTAAQYLAGKLATLVGLSAVASLVIMAVHGHVAEPGLLLACVLLTAATFLCLGIPVALRFRTVNGYLVGSSGLLAPIVAPAFLALWRDMPALFDLWPPVAQLRLMLVALGAVEAGGGERAVLLCVVGIATLLSLWLALAALRRELGK